MFTNDPLLAVTTIIFVISVLFGFFWYLWFYLAPLLLKTNDNDLTPQPVSVIICARNEAENLATFLPSVLEQDYPEYEVIVVNDCSDDNTYIVLGELMAKYTHLRVSSVNKDPQFTHSKKFAQFIGIKAAHNELLLFTDADCKPVSEKWIASMVSNFSAKKSFVLGYGGYIQGKGLLNNYIRYDTLTIALQYTGMALRGIPYMGVGRNLAYRKSVFFESRGFSDHYHIASGDDDLFVNANANKSNTAVEIREEAHTRSLAPLTVKNWITQKQRHLSTAPYYKLRDKFLLTMEPFFRVLFYTSFTILIINQFLWQYCLGIFVLRLITQLSIFMMAAKRFKEKGIGINSMIFDIFSPLINTFVYISGSLRRPGRNKWK